MTDEAMSPLRRRMIENWRTRPIEVMPRLGRSNWRSCASQCQPTVWRRGTSSTKSSRTRTCTGRRMPSPVDSPQGRPAAYAATKVLLDVWSREGWQGARAALYGISMPLFDTSDAQTALRNAPRRSRLQTIPKDTFTEH
jgi:hypothetical protein